MALREPQVRPSADGQGRRSAVGAPAVPMRRRRLPLTVVAVLVAASSALVFALLWLNAGDRRAVLAVAAAVSAGEVIEAGDLVVVRVSVDPVLAPLPASARADVIGETATVDLVAGTLLTDAQVGAEALLPTGQAVVGLALDGGQVPTPRLGAGDRVQVVATAVTQPTADAAEDGALGRVMAEGEVFAIEPAAQGAGVLVSLIVDEDVPADIAGAAAADRVSLVLVGSP